MIILYFIGVYKLPNEVCAFDAIDFVKSNKKIKGCLLGS